MYKAYIVANKQQEREVLEKLEREGMTWSIINEKPTDFAPSVYYIVSFPYVILVNNWISWNWLSNLKNEEIVYDGRKEEQMSDKYVVSQEFMNELEKWKADIRHEWLLKKDDGKWLNSADISDLENITEDWWLDTEIPYKESNNRLITIVRWVNGEDVFEVEKPKKWIVRSKETDEDGDYHYVNLDNFKNLKSVSTLYGLDFATKFNTKEEAQSWANSHQEVIEVEE